MTAPLSVEQLERATRLQAEGKTHWQIAEILGVTRVTISRNLGGRNLRLNKLLEERIAEERVRQVECLQWLQSFCMDCFRGTREPFERIERARIREGTGDGAKVSYRVRKFNLPRDGEPAFLHAALGCMAAIRKVYGLEKGSKPSDLTPLVQGIVAGFLRYVPPEFHQSILDGLNQDFRGAFGRITATPEGVPLPPLPDGHSADDGRRPGCPVGGYPSRHPRQDQGS
jgi:hypothetical protein